MAKLTSKQYSLIEKTIFTVGAVALVVIGYSVLNSSKAKNRFVKSEAAQINYEMAKLQTNERLYSLEGREIEVNFKALVKAGLKSAAKKAVTDKVKTVAAVKQAAVVPAAKAVSKLITKNNQPKKDIAQKYNNQTADTQNINDVTEASNLRAAANYQDITTPVKPVVLQEAPATKTFEQWKSEIFATQNKEVILKLAAAFKKYEVTAEVFQKLVNEMLISKDDKMVGLGLYALRAAPSYNSFVQLVKIQSALNSTYAAYVQESLNSYNQSTGLAVLKQSLGSTDKVVVLKSLEIIKAGLNSIQNGTTSDLVDSRDRRYNDNETFSFINYLSFMPVLKNIASTSNDQDVINLANQNINLIDDSRVVASN